MIKYLYIVILFGLIMILIYGCAKASSPTSSGTSNSSSPQDPPLPRVASIIPLGKGRQWNFSTSVYDSLGNKTFEREALALSMPAVFGLRNGILKELIYDPNAWSQPNYNDSNYEFVYKYEWDGKKINSLIFYRDVDVPVSGIYIYGKYFYNKIIKYPEPQLWLRYPSSAGDTWTYIDFDSNLVPLDTFTMETVSPAASFHLPRAGEGTPVRFIKCYQYKETIDTLTSSYYFHPDIGCVGYIGMVNGKRKQTYYQTYYSSYGYYRLD